MVVYENETKVEVKAKEQMPKLVAAGHSPNKPSSSGIVDTSSARSACSPTDWTGDCNPGLVGKQD